MADGARAAPTPAVSRCRPSETRLRGTWQGSDPCHAPTGRVSTGSAARPQLGVPLGSPRDLLVARPAGVERTERVEHGPRVALVPLRGDRARVADRRAALRPRGPGPAPPDPR